LREGRDLVGLKQGRNSWRKDEESGYLAFKPEAKKKLTQ